MEKEEENSGGSGIVSLVLQYLDFATQNPEKWLNLLHNNIVLEFPYAESAGLPRFLAGKEMIQKSTADFLGMVPGIRFNNPEVFPGLNPHQAFATYGVKVLVPATNKTYEQQYIAVFTEQDGQIVHMTEYYDPTKLNAAFQ